MFKPFNGEWCDGSGRINLTLTEDQVRHGYHSGDCDLDIAILKGVPAIQTQLDAIDASILVTVLKEYGAWSKSELQDHEQNLTRILWLACGDIVDKNI